MSKSSSTFGAPTKILFQLSGSIAAYKACALVSRLVQEGHEVQAVMTQGARKFVGEATLEGLTGRKVFTDLFAAGERMDHIHWARWADVALLCPASASAINRLASGIAEDAVGALFLAWDLKRPYAIAPAMNHQMWAHPATRESVNKLERYGVAILGPDAGHQACGETGPGRMMEPEKIYDALLERIKPWLGC